MENPGDKNKLPKAPRGAAPFGDSPGFVMPRKVVVLGCVDPKNPDLQTDVYRLHKERIVLGSVISADVRLTGEGIAPIHAVLEVNRDSNGEQSQTATVYDLASETGVFVNGSRSITEVVRTGDKITIGAYTLRFSLEDVESVASRERVRESEGRKLFLNPKEDLVPLLLQDEREVEEVFDYRPASKLALEVVMSWRGTILNVEHFVSQSSVTIGNDRRSDFAIPPLLSSARYPIVTRRASQYTLSIDTNMSGVVQRQGRIETLEQIRSLSTPGKDGYRLAFSKDDFAKIRVGEVDFYLSFTAAPPRLKSGRLFEKDPLFLKILSGSLLMTAAVIAAIMNIPVTQTLEAEQLPERIVTILYQPERFVRRPELPVPRQKAEPQKQPPSQTPPPKPVPRPTTKLDLKPNPANRNKPIPKVIETSGTKQGRAAPRSAAGRSQGASKEGAGARAKGKEGTRGTPRAKTQGEPQNRAQRASPRGGAGAGEGRSQVPDLGNVEMLKGASHKLQNLLGDSAARLGKGGDKVRGFGAFNTVGEGGLALSGSGPGGGGAAEGPGGLIDKGIGGGRVGTGRSATGTGSGIIGGKARVVIRSGGTEEAIVMGAIDADAVEAALLAHRDEFRLCYEREINAENPKLAGRVGTSFVIGSSGRVTQAGISSTTLRNANVERCVLNVIRRVEFPIPRGGGVVQVTYPFKFNSLGKQ